MDRADCGYKTWRVPRSSPAALPWREVPKDSLSSVLNHSRVLSVVPPLTAAALPLELKSTFIPFPASGSESTEPGHLVGSSVAGPHL